MIFVRIKRWLDPPEFPGEAEKNRVARLMNTLGLYFALLLTIAALFFVPYFVIYKTLAWVILAALMSFYLISRYLMFRGQIKLSGTVIVMGAWAVFQGVEIFSGGVTSPASIAVLGAIIIIGLLPPTLAGRLIVLFTILIGLEQAILQTNQQPFPMFFHFTPLAAWFWYTLSIGFVFSAVSLITSNLQKALTRAHDMETQLREEIAQRKIMETHLRYLSTHDSLTGIYNRLFFEEELARLELGREYPVSIIALDVDGLKAVNDAHGHATGDELLRRVTEVLCSVFRAGDIVARIGGDEFAVLLPRTDAAAVEKTLSRIRAKVAKQNIQYPDLPVQLSLGASTAERDNLTASFIISDQKMYADKALRRLTNG